MAKQAHPFRSASTALYEGKILRKTGKIIGERYHHLVQSVDFFFGKISRYFMMKKVDVQSNKIIFIPFQGDYTCNLKAITEELIAQKIDCEIVWAVRKATLSKTYMYPAEITFVDQYTLEYYEQLASSKIWIVNSVDFLKRKVYKKPDQILIETWHGSLGIKRFDAAVNAGKSWIRAAEYCGKVTDYCISNSTFENDVYRDTFWSNSKILEYGHPRNDVLIDSEKTKKARERVSKELDLPDDTHFVLYGPTFRDDHQFRAYTLDYQRLCEALSNHYGGEWVVITRFHPTVRKFAQSRGRLDGCVDATAYDDIQELMCVADFAVTDYSSWIYDFALTGKPGLIFATDLDEYYTERGFYYPLTDTPFPVCRTNDDVVATVNNFSDEEYESSIKEFLEGKGCIEDGNASARVVQLASQLMKEEKGNDNAGE